MPKRYLAYILYYNLSGILRLGVLRAYRFGVRRVDVRELGVALESNAVQTYLSSEEEKARVIDEHVSLLLPRCNVVLYKDTLHENNVSLYTKRSVRGLCKFSTRGIRNNVAVSRRQRGSY